MPRFPLRTFSFGAGLIALGAVLLASLIASHIEVTLRLAGFAPALLSILIGSIIAVFSVAAWRWQRHARLHGTRGAGFVEAVERSELAGMESWRVRVRFRHELGRELHFRTGRLRAKPTVRPGERVAIWVCSHDPARYHFIELGPPLGPRPDPGSADRTLA
jgi:hypothetical protein